MSFYVFAAAVVQPVTAGGRPATSALYRSLGHTTTPGASIHCSLVCRSAVSSCEVLRARLTFPHNLCSACGRPCGRPLSDAAAPLRRQRCRQLPPDWTLGSTLVRIRTSAPARFSHLLSPPMALMRLFETTRWPMSPLREIVRPPLSLASPAVAAAILTRRLHPRGPLSRWTEPRLIAGARPACLHRGGSDTAVLAPPFSRKHV